MFVATRLADMPAKNQSGYNHSRHDATREQAVRALSVLRPRGIWLDAGDPHHEVYGVRFNKRCQFRGFLGTDHDIHMRSVAQPASWAACMDMIELAEKEDGQRYDWVAKARMDLYWFAAHPHVCSLNPGVIYTNARAVSVDHYFILPRHVATHVMRVVEAYKSCDGVFPFGDVESWLIGGFINATGEHSQYEGLDAACVGLTKKQAHRVNPLGFGGSVPNNPLVSTRAGIADVVFPAILVRNSSTDPDAGRFVRRTCFLYASIAGKSWPDLCQEADAWSNATMQSHVQHTYLKCLRAAYPDDDPPGDYGLLTNWRWWLGVIHAESNCPDRSTRFRASRRRSRTS